MPRASTARLATAALLAATGAAALGACASSPGTAAGATPAATTATGCPAAHITPAATASGTAIGRAERGDDGAVRDARVALGQICAMMAQSAAAWNRGELDTFMSDYMPGEGTTFIGRRGVLRGTAAIREVYAPRFGPGGVRDSLSFESVEVDLLAPDLANTIAWYVLARGDSVVARGPTSLVMRRVEGRWRIVHDHSS